MALEKFEQIIPMGKQEFAYQCEDVSSICVISGRMPRNNGALPYPSKEKEDFDEYELRISKFTSNALMVELIKFPSQANRMANRREGKLVRSKIYQANMSFSGLVNQIFKNVEVAEYQEEIPIPQSVADELKRQTK